MAHIGRGGIEILGLADAELVDRHGPALVEFPQQLGPSLAVSRLGVLVAAGVDTLLSLAGSDVVGIEIEDLVVGFVGLVPLGGILVALGVVEEVLHRLDLATERWGDGPVIVRGILEVGQDDYGPVVIGIVGGIEDRLAKILGVLIAALGDALLREVACGGAEAIEGLAAEMMGDIALREEIAGGLVLGKRGLVVALIHCGGAGRHGRLRSADILLLA